MCKNDQDGNAQSPKSIQIDRQKYPVRPIHQDFACPTIKNHTSVHYKNQLIFFGGYDARKNHNDVFIYADEKWRSVKTSGKSPEGRNGHTATVAENKMFVIGGWLGSGTHASKDVYVLDLDDFNWTQLNTSGESPGPCNMHSADLINNLIYIFRGGDGQDYLNDLHTLNTKSFVWKRITPGGDSPPPRANHSSSVIKDKLYIFGGWDGVCRLNDLYQYDTVANRWLEVKHQNPPSARAGMCMAAFEDKIYLFGGSGPQVTCYGDLQCYDPKENSWTVHILSDEVQARAGHSMTLIDTKLYIFGGSCGQLYFKDFFAIEIDPPPELEYQDNSDVSIYSHFRKYFNQPQFSDIQFVVQGQRYFAHKLILSREEYFRNSFAFEWGSQEVISINDHEPRTFECLLIYIYKGEFVPEPQTWSLDFTIKMLNLSDQYLVQGIKAECGRRLREYIDKDNLQKIWQIAEQVCTSLSQSNSYLLARYCNWYQKRFRV